MTSWRRLSNLCPAKIFEDETSGSAIMKHTSARVHGTCSACSVWKPPAPHVASKNGRKLGLEWK